jgi:AcrR family transcriptional regulator
MSSPEPSRRDVILEAALRCFLRRGYDATTIQDIREESGASIGSIYHAFAGKDAIAAELLSSTVDAWQRSLVARLDGASDAEGFVRSAVEHYLDWVVTSPDRARFLLHAPRARLEEGARERVKERNAELSRDLRARIKPHLGALRAMPMDLLIPVVIGPAMEWSRQWLAGYAKSSPEQARRALADAAWAAVRK